MRKLRNTKLTTNDERKSNLVSEPNHPRTKPFFENLI